MVTIQHSPTAHGIQPVGEIKSVLPHLPESIHAYALTQRGHGDADHPATGYRFENFAPDLEAFVDAVGLRRVVLVGHSLGSYVSQRFAMDDPDRVWGFVLIGSVTTWRGNEAILGVWESGFATLTDPIDPAFVREFQSSPRLAPDRLDVAVEESLKAPARVWQASWRAIMETDYSAELGKIRAPTLILRGEQDPLCPRSEQEALIAAIPGSRLVVYPSGGHNLHWEEPERVAEDIAAFVAPDATIRDVVSRGTGRGSLPARLPITPTPQLPPPAPPPG